MYIDRHRMGEGVLNHYITPFKGLGCQFKNEFLFFSCFSSCGRKIKITAYFPYINKYQIQHKQQHIYIHMHTVLSKRSKQQRTCVCKQIRKREKSTLTYPHIHTYMHFLLAYADICCSTCAYIKKTQ